MIARILTLIYCFRGDNAWCLYNFRSDFYFWITSLFLCRCLPLTVANGVVMPDTKQCNSEFSSCVARKWDETMGVDDNGFPLDIDKLCMGELQSIEPCKAETQVLYGANIRIVCELGYTNGTAATLRPFCTSNGSFSNHAICEKKSCGIFRALNNSVSEEVNKKHCVLPTCVGCNSFSAFVISFV